MRREDRFVGSLLLAGALLAGIVVAPGPIMAQNVRDDRINLYDPGPQVGIITRVKGTTAWIQMPHRVPGGSKAEFLFYSDGGDVMALGNVRFVMPIAPYEAYVTDIKAVSTLHDINDYDSLWAAEAISREKRPVGSRPESDPFGVSLAIGLFARTPIAPTPPDSDGIEPVRALINVLRTRSNKTARAIADAAEHALEIPVPDTEIDFDWADGVNYHALADSLNRFRRIRIEDPITERVLRRMLNLIEENGYIEDVVPIDFLRPTPAINLPGGQYGTRP
jgi:hypothetical protein